MENSLLSGICPKCGSEEVYVARPGTIGQHPGSSNSIPVDWRTHVAQRNYICLSCFYVEIYAPMTDTQMEQVRKNWVRVKDVHRAGKRKDKNDG